jgi:hypothetical protein
MATSTSKEPQQDCSKFLKENSFLFERVKAGIDVFPSDSDVKIFQNIAKSIAPKVDFHVKGCQECVNSLVNFVYQNKK